MKLMLFDFATRKWSVLNRDRCHCAFPSWSHDGKYVYFLSTPKKERVIYRIRVGDRKAELVVDLKELRVPSEGFWFLWVGLAQDDSPLLVRDAGIRAIYALDWDIQ